MLAVIKTGGKQYIIKPGDKIKVEKLEKKDGEEITFDEVLLLERNKKLSIGTPTVKGAKVVAKVLETKKGKKVIAFKYSPKKRYKLKKGHRQAYTLVEIKEIPEA
ncbi:50S ribosomal protein L21 [Patescibacteria group bacterium]|nr:50S ribosomal protein L21 [Patescibacteria group bacterium]MBU4162105.1 50S ribosomal protein L21 [Patescibacteria group bacterium]